MTKKVKSWIGKILEFHWTVQSRGDRYPVCTMRTPIYNGIQKLAACNGGGYDMRGTCLGTWLCKEFADEIRKIKLDKYPDRNDGRQFYGLSFRDPNYDPGKAIVEKPDGVFTKEGDVPATVEQLEKEGKSLGLDRYQAVHRASSPVPTKNHTVPYIDGACGEDCVRRIMNAMGFDIKYIPTTHKRDSMYEIVTYRKPKYA